MNPAAYFKGFLAGIAVGCGFAVMVMQIWH